MIQKIATARGSILVPMWKAAVPSTSTIEIATAPLASRY
jgi:hypothetical protein